MSRLTALWIAVMIAALAVAVADWPPPSRPGPPPRSEAWTW